MSEKEKIRWYLGARDNRIPFCRFDTFLYNGEHCRHCPYYHGTLTMTCQKIIIGILK
jgi:hypothetical protein